jgi:hypothetical protein
LFRVEGLQVVGLLAEADEFAALHQHRAHHWIRRSRAVAAPGKPEGEAHELGVRHRHAA